MDLLEYFSRDTGILANVDPMAKQAAHEGPWYHGTGRPGGFEPGQIVDEEGAQRERDQLGGGMPKVYLTPNPQHAAYHGRNNAMGRYDYFGQGEAYPRVYEMEPLEGLEHVETGATVKRARVKREVEYKLPNGKGYEQDAGDYPWGGTETDHKPAVLGHFEAAAEGTRFMPMHELLALPSPRFHEETGKALENPPTVHSRFPSIEEDVARSPGYYGELEKSMRTRGQTVPIAIDTTPYEDGRPTLGGGHHRIYFAHKLGWPGLHVMDDPEFGPEGHEVEDVDWNHAHPFYSGPRRHAVLEHFEAAGPRMLDLYHHTSPRRARSIVDSGVWKANQKNTEDYTPHIYFSDRQHEEAAEFGRTAIHVRVPEDVAIEDDEFDSGEKHYAVPVEHLDHAEIVGTHYQKEPFRKTQLTGLGPPAHADMSEHLTLDHGISGEGQMGRYLKSLNEDQLAAWHRSLPHTDSPPHGGQVHSHEVPAKQAAAHPELEYHHLLQGRKMAHPFQAVLAAHDGDVVGHLSWGPGSAHVGELWVHPDWRHRGIATALWNHSQALDKPPVHHGDRSDAGDAWARSVTPDVPERKNNTADPDADEARGRFAAKTLGERLQSGDRHIERIAAARPGRGEKKCPCCKGNGEHGDGSECDPCDGQGIVHVTSEPDRYCPGQPQPRRRHWREAAVQEGPLTLEYAHNTEKAPDMGETYGQHVEPHGRYMVEREPGDSYDRDPRWETGTVTFRKPLHVPYGGLSSEPDNWKHQLSERYQGKRGKALSRAVAKDGYDGIVTHDEDGSTREIVDLASFHKQAAGASPDDGDVVSHFARWQNEPGDKTKYTPVSVRHAGFAGLVGDSEDERELRHDLGETGAEDEHPWENFDEDLHDATAPEPTEDERAEQEENGESESYMERHDQAYEEAFEKRKQRRIAEETPDIEDPGLRHFRDHHGSNTELWRTHGTFGPVSLKQPVYATQTHVAKEHIERYQNDREGLSNAHRQNPDRERIMQGMGMEYLGDKHPLFVTHEGRVHAIEGHHRIATDMAMGRHETVGWHFNLDHHPRLASFDEEDPDDWENLVEHHPHKEAAVSPEPGRRKAARIEDGAETTFESPKGGSYTLRYRTEDQGEQKPRRIIEAFTPEGHPVGRLNWYGTTGRIHHIEVAGSEDDPSDQPDLGDGQNHRRKGLATAMWNWGREIHPKLQHSGDRTTHGIEWAKAVGGPGLRNFKGQPKAAVVAHFEAEPTAEQQIPYMKPPGPGAETTEHILQYHTGPGQPTNLSREDLGLHGGDKHWANWHLHEHRGRIHETHQHLGPVGTPGETHWPATFDPSEHYYWGNITGERPTGWHPENYGGFHPLAPAEGALLRHFAVANPDELPPDPGTAPIPEGHIRLWHYTPNKNVASIREHGLQRKYAQGDAMNGDLSDPSAGMWASTKRPDELLDSHDSAKSVVEFHAHPREISGNAESPWQAERRREPGQAWEDREYNPEKLADWASGYHHVIMHGDVHPSQILAIHEPWHAAARYMRDDPAGPASYQWVRDEYAAGGNDHLEPYVRGLDALERHPKTAAAEPARYYHGTTAEGLTEVRPMGHRRFYPTEHDGDYAHATTSLRSAWHYWADNAWHETGKRARVYEVEPTGPVEQDPLRDNGGSSRRVSDDDVRSKHPWRVVREMPVPEDLDHLWGSGWEPEGSEPHTAVLQATAALENPYTGKSIWYHGTQADPEDIRQHGLHGADEFAHGRFEVPESETDDSGHWNAMLGTHFTADHAIAGEFARGEHEGSDNEGYGGEDEEHHGIIHAHVHLNNPKFYDSEHDLDHEAYEHEFAAGNHPQDHHPGLGKHYEGEPDFDDPDVDERINAEDMWPNAHRIAQDYGRQEIPASTYGHHNSPFEQHPMRTGWLNTHPDKYGIAMRHKKRLEDQGYDGVVYRNEYERSNRGGAANTSIIAFHPERQVEITQHHDADQATEASDPEPRGHLATLAALEHPAPSFTWRHETYGPDGGYVTKEDRVEGPFYHGGRANLKPGGMIKPGQRPNSWGDTFDDRGRSVYTYFAHEPGTATSYARETGGHMYEVEPTGEVSFDGSGGDGSWKSKHPLRVVRKIPQHEWDSLPSGRISREAARTAKLVLAEEAADGAPATGLALWHAESPEEARGMLGDLPGFFSSVAGSLDALAGRFDDSPADPRCAEIIRRMADACRVAEDDAREIVARLPAAEGVCEDSPGPGPKA